MLKKILLFVSIFAIVATVAHAVDNDLKTPASKAYVDVEVAKKQNKIPAANQPGVGEGETVMTYTAAGNGQIGERGIYDDASSYDASTDADKLITASALNATFTNLPTTGTTKLQCANSPTCSLWTVVDQTAYGRIHLPNGYTQLQYIESTGTQYINTGIAPNNNLALKVVFAFTGNTSSSRRVFGKILGSSSTALNYREVGTVFYWFGSISNSGITPDNQKHTIEFRSDGKVYRDNAEIGTKSTFGTGVENPMYLFAELSDGYAVNYGQVKVYGWEVYNQGVLIQKFIPAKNSNNVIGMYDTVSEQFFTNAASTGPDFTAGPPVAN